MRKEQILGYIDVYDATPEDKRKQKIREIADGLGMQPWEVAETLKAAGCNVNLQWFNQLKRKAMQAGGVDPDERAAEAASAAAPADAGYLRKIIVRQDRQLKEDAEKYKALEERAKDLGRQLHDKDAELAKKDAEIAMLQRRMGDLNAELFRLGEEKEHLEILVNEADNDNVKLHEILDQYEAELDNPAERHFFGIEGGEDVADGDGRGDAAKELRCNGRGLPCYDSTPAGETSEGEATLWDAKQAPAAFLVAAFVCEMEGYGAWLMGDLIDALYAYARQYEPDCIYRAEKLVRALIANMEEDL